MNIKKVITSFSLIIFFVALTPFSNSAQKRQYSGSKVIKWNHCLNQPREWYAGTEAVRIADNVLLYQKSCGGWEKNIDMAAQLDSLKIVELRDTKNEGETTIDNGATYTQMIYLAAVYNATHIENYKKAFLKGFDYLLAAQYDNGGWPQFYPLRKGYYTHITFNDNAMINTMRTLKFSYTNPEFSFVDSLRKEKARIAVNKGIECILKCQIKVNGKLTAWCAQHDEKTFEPAKARTYELPTISGSESVDITEFLMNVENPAPEIIDAVQSAVAWLDEVKLKGIKVKYEDDASALYGKNKVVVADSSAPPIWARFYEIGSNKPVFCSRDGIVHYDISEISSERRNGYNWLDYWPLDLLTNRYPAWIKKYSLTNRLNNN